MKPTCIAKPEMGCKWRFQSSNFLYQAQFFLLWGKKQGWWPGRSAPWKVVALAQHRKFSALHNFTVSNSFIWMIQQLGRYRMLTQARELPLQMYQCIHHRYFFQNCPHYTSPPSQIGPFFIFFSMTGIDGIFSYGILFFFFFLKISFTNLAPDTSRFLSENGK